MDAVTYPESEVADYIKDNFIPLRIGSSTEPYCVDFMVKWTPRTIVLSSFGVVHQSKLGFFPPEEFIPSLELGLARADFDSDRLDECQKRLERIIDNYPQSASAPEAVYLRGVTSYKISGDAASLKDAYHTLKDTYSSSEWVARALPYRLL